MGRHFSNHIQATATRSVDDQIEMAGKGAHTHTQDAALQALQWYRNLNAYQMSSMYDKNWSKNADFLQPGPGNLKSGKHLFLADILESCSATLPHLHRFRV